MCLMILSGGFAAYFAGMNMISTIVKLIYGSVILTTLHSWLYKNKKKNFLREFVFVVTPVEILITFVLNKYSLSVVKICLLIGLLLILVYLIIFNCASKKHKLKKYNSIRGIYSILVFCMIPCIVSFVSCWIYDKPILKENSYLISTDISCSAAQITGDEWKGMIYKEKFEYLNLILEAEAQNLCMEDTPEVQAVIYPENIYGAYDYSTDTIFINAELLRTSSADMVIETLGHELYHRYEHIIVADESKNITGVEKERIEEYRYEFENPQMIVDWIGYYRMSIETDARAAGERTVEKYVVET
ncbi:MAG: hypothetical protein J6A05_06005 [Oscillospiraceae bacterium]|nr:hypothetical protein [Oscillospiraceae bacterium]